MKHLAHLVGSATTGWFFSLILLLPLSVSAADSVTGQNMLLLGEKMYREGMLPSGEKIKGGNDGKTTPGTSFTCASCHLFSGLGSSDEGVLVLPVNGQALYQPRDLPGVGNNRRNAGMTMTSNKRNDSSVQPAQARPAYNDKTLAEVIRVGRDPAGRTLNLTMPRYNLSDSDMSLLVSYLKNLSTDYSPGVSKEFITFATIIAEGVPEDQVAAMMNPLESFVKSANKQQVDLEAQRARLREKYLEPTYRRVKLSRWVLKGSPASWRGQLEEYYRQEPVFALLAGIAKEWQPVHEFCETNKIPCILPSTEFPVVSSKDFYTLYFSKGYYQEGEAAAHYLLSQDSPIHGKKLVQLVSNSPIGKKLAEGFTQTLVSQGQPQPVSIQLTDNQPATAEFVRQIIEKEKPELLVLWTNADVLQHVATVTGNKTATLRIMASAGYLDKNLHSIPEQLRNSTYITYPYRLPQDELRYERFLKSADKKEKMTDEIRIIKSRTYSALKVITQALREMKGNFYRENLFDVIGMMRDIEFPLYERLSFGTDQRYASKGCYIVQLSEGEKAQLVKKSEWVIN